MRDAFFRFMKAVDMSAYNAIKTSEWGKKTSYINSLHLYIIGHNERTTVSELAETLKISRSAVTQKIQELEAEGLVKKVQSETDKRVYYISLSDKLEEDRQNTRIATVLDAVDTAFSEEDKAAFTNILDFMTTYISDEDE